jgi:chromosome segregation ATPase
MGSIDEMALENLGLIIDLTKNIQIKSSMSEEEVDYEDFAFYMPSFLWVVRDFALELVDQSGKALTSKSYLENSLMEQKGFSEQIEQKNRIRRLLTAFFQDRECFTMVRPAVEEDVLRNIEKANQDNLRPEFIEQMVALRKMILSHAKVKTMENVELNGEMLASLAKSYLDAINTQKVPVIENCWTYICKSQCNRAFDEALKTYNDEMSEAFERAWPVSQQTLKALHKDSKDSTIKDFKKNAVGEFQDELFNQLLDEMQRKYEFFKSENVACFEKIFKKYMNESYQNLIEKNLTTRAYKSFIDFDRDIKKFENYFQEADTNGPNKSLLLAEFLNKKITEAIYLFIGQLESTHEEMIRGLRQKKDNLEEEIKTIKEENERNRKKFELSLADLHNENQKLLTKIKIMDDAFENFKKESNNDNERNNQKMKEKIEALNSEMDNSRKENNGLRDKIKALEKEIIIKKSDFDEKKELLEHQVKFYEERMKTISQSDETRDKEAMKLINEHNLKLKENTEKFEKLIEGKEVKIRELNECLIDFEERIDGMRRELDKATSEFSNREINYKSQIHDLAKKYELVQERAKSLEESNLASQSTMMSDHKNSEIRERLSQYEEEIKARDDKLKQLKQQYEKEKVLQKQSNEFFEAKNSDLKRQLEETKKLYEDTLNALECNANVEKSDFTNQLAEITESHKKEVKSLEMQIEVTKNELNEQISRLTDENDELQKIKRELEERMKKEVMQLRESLESSDRTRLQLKKELANLENEKEELLQAHEEKYSQKIRSLEAEIRRLKEELTSDLESQKYTQEEELRKMKSFYNAEKEKLESRLLEEKESFQRKFAQTVKNYEEQLELETENHEQELDLLRGELSATKQQAQAQMQNLEDENAKRAEQNAALENQLNMITSDYETLKKNFNHKVEEIREMYEAEKTELLAANEVYKKEKAERDNEFWNLNQKFHSLNSELSKVNEFSTMQISACEKEITRLKEELEDTKTRAEKITNENVEQKIDLGKKVALSTQQNQFLTHRIEDLTKQLDYSQKKLDERLQLQRDEYEKEIHSLKNKFNEEKTDLESKYESKRKSLKEIERTYTEKIAAIESSKGILQEKLSQLKSEFEKNEAHLLQEKKDLQQRIDQLTTKLENSQKDLLAANEELKKDKYRLEMEYAELQATLEKETALWDGKLKFLEEQKDQLKKERDHSQKNFDLMLQKFQKIRSSEKEENLSSQNAIIANVETRYNAQISEINEKHKQALQTMNDRNARLEREIKLLNEKLLNENNAKFDNYHNLERKLNEKIENEKLLEEQISKIKQDRENKIQQAQKKFEEELDRYRNIISNMEDKVKDAEKRRSAATFEHEKDKAKWAAEMDHFQRGKIELLDKNQDLEAQKEKLIKENEKLKNEVKKSRLLSNDQNNGFKFRPPTFNSSRIQDRSFAIENDRAMMRYMTKDNSRNFLPDNISDNDSGTNGLLDNLNQNS